MLRRSAAAVLVLSVAVLGTAAISEAVGFRIAAQGAKAMGMNGAFAAQADDPSAIYYNPAGIGQLEGTQVQLGATFIYNPGTEFEPFPGQVLPGGSTAQPTEISTRIFTLPQLYATRKINDRLSLGLGTYTPYGLQVDWPDNWAGRQIVTFAELSSHYLDFVAAYEVMPGLTLSGGVDFVYADARLARTTFTGGAPPETLIQFDGDGTTYTYEGGLLFRPNDWLRVGAVYRHQAVVELEGDIKLEPVPSAPSPLSTQPPSQSASTKIPLPSTLALGVAVEPADRVTVEFDWDFTHWSSFEDLSLRVPGSVILEGGLATASPSPNRRWKDSHIFRLGAQYQVSDALAVRAGVGYITTPIPDETFDPIVPDSDRTVGTTGFGYSFTEHLTLDFAYEYQHFHDRAKNNQVLVTAVAPGLRANGTYRTDAHVFLTHLKYKF